MFNLSISKELVQAELDDIFRRIEHADTPEIREHEANYAWFQIHGMHKLLKLGGEISFYLFERRGSERYKEYEKVLEMLEEALKKAEQAFDEYRH